MTNRTPPRIDGMVFPGADRAPEGRAVLLVTVGTTAAELHLIMRAQRQHEDELMPSRGLAVDSLSYEDLVARQVQNGWPEAEVEAVLPRSCYLRLTSPLTEGFDFDAPLNRDILKIIHEPAMRPLAARPDSPGCGGHPFNGNLVVQVNEQLCSEFFTRHYHELTRAGSTETIALRAGIEIRFVVAYRGGTGTGAILPLAAIARSVAPADSRLHLTALMPDVYGGDLKAHAAAYAAMLECQAFHSDGDGKGVPLKDGRTLPAPFHGVTYTFSSNGAVSLGPKDALQEAAEVLRCYLRPATQSAINTRHVDLDAPPFDLEDKPTHIRVQTATSIRTIAPEVHGYLGVELLRQRCTAADERFESWSQELTLTSQETSEVQQSVTRVIEGERLTLPALLERLDGAARPETQLLAFFEQASNEVAGLRADGVKALVQEVPGKARALCGRLEQSLSAAATALTGSLAPSLVTELFRVFAGREHLALAALAPLALHLEQVKAEAEERAADRRKQRENLNLEVGAALSDVQSAGGIAILFNKDGVARDTAGRALDLLYRGGLARIQQLRCELLAASLGRVLEALADARPTEERRVRERHAARSVELRTRLESLRRRLDCNSPRFQRFMLFDGATPASLEKEARQLLQKLPEPPALRAYLEGRTTLSAATSELLALLPAWAESQKGLAELVLDDPARRAQLIQLLRSVRPFTVIDRTVEAQQGLPHRRDRLTVMELPGGQDGPFAQLMLAEGIVENVAQIVEASGDEIRLFFLREGIPYAAIQQAKTYQALFDRYRANPASISPFTVANAHRLPSIEAPTTNLQHHVRGVLWEAKAVLDDRLQELRAGGFLLRYPSDTGNGFIVTLEERFADLAALVGWVSKRAAVRKAVERELREAFESRTQACVVGLLSAWHRARSPEREHLEDVLHGLRVDPRKELAAHAETTFLA